MEETRFGRHCSEYCQCQFSCSVFEFGPYTSPDSKKESVIRIDQLSPETRSEFLAKSHAYMKDLVFKHASRFECRTYYSTDRMDATLQAFCFLNRDPDGLRFPRIKFPSVDLSHSEKERIMRACYTIAVTHLQSFYWIKVETRCRRKSISKRVFDLAPILRLSFRQLLELAVALRVLFIEAGPSIATTSFPETYHLECEPNFQMFETGALRRLLPTILSIKTKIVYDKQLGLSMSSEPELKELYKPVKHTARFESLKSCRHPLRSIFFDENQGPLSQLFDHLETSAMDSPHPEARLILPLALAPEAGTEGKDLKEWVCNLNEVIRQQGAGAAAELVAVRVDKDGLVNFSEDGNPLDCDSKDGSWRISHVLDIQDLYRMSFW